MSTRIPFQLFPRTNKTFTSFGVEVMPRLKYNSQSFKNDKLYFIQGERLLSMNYTEDEIY